MVQVFKSVKITEEDYHIYDGLLKEIGHIRIPQVTLCKYDQIVGLQVFCGDAYLGKTLFVRCVKVYYDRWGFPFYRFARYTGTRSKTADYNEFKTLHLMGANNV